MERQEALSRIRTLVGKDLRALADQLGVPVWVGGKLEKGWAGQTIERFLGLPRNSSRAPNFGSWELKVVPVRYVSGILRPKETMAITMIDPIEVAAKEFEGSHLLNKLKKMVVVARVFESRAETRSVVCSAGEFDLNDPSLYVQVKADYELVRSTIKAKGFDALTGRMGVHIQPRTKGRGHGSTSRAFYARKELVSRILGPPG